MLDVKTYFKRHIKCRYIFIKELNKIVGRKSSVKRIYDNKGKLISKECTCCREIKPVSEFHKCEKSKDGLFAQCKKCRNKNNKKYRQENPDYFKKYKQENPNYFKKYYQENPDYFKKHNKKYRQENPDKIKGYNKKYRQENPNYFNEYNKKYYQENKESKKEYDKEYGKEYRDKQRQEAIQQIKIELESNPREYNYIEGKEIFGIIYLVHNIKSNRYYVGQTTIGFDNRYPKGWLFTHGHKNTVKEDLELYGEDSFEYTKIFKVTYSQYELDKLEAYYIDYYDSYEKGYNENRGNIFTDRGKEK